MNLCYEMNMILSSYGYFLRIFEIKKKFHHLSVKSKDNQKLVRQLSSCLMEKINGFTIISIEYQKKTKEKHLNRLISFINQQKQIEIEPICYLSKAFSSLYSDGKRGVKKAHKVRKCYYSNKYFITETTQKRHIQNCTGKPGIVYNFNNQCLISYQDIFS